MELLLVLEDTSKESQSDIEDPDDGSEVDTYHVNYYKQNKNKDRGASDDSSNIKCINM